MKGEQKQKEKRKIGKTQTLHVCDFSQTQDCRWPRPVVLMEVQAPAHISFLTTTKFH